MKYILGTKISMTQVWNDEGKVVPVTQIQAGPCVVTQIKTQEKDGYVSVQVGFGKKRHLTKALMGHAKGNGSFQYFREFRVKDGSEVPEVGDTVTADVFQPGDIVTVSALSKGKGFQGVVKRHGFHGAPASHGHKDQLRMPGSIGATDAARVFKGTRMAGRMGGKRATALNLEIVSVDAGNNILNIKGAVPGARNGLVTIRMSSLVSKASDKSS